MPFPTTSILDSLNRANSGTLGGSWQNARIWGGNSNLMISSNVATPDTVDLGCSDYWGSNFNADQEVWATVPAIGSGDAFISLYARMTHGGGTFGPGETGYGLLCQGGTTGELAIEEGEPDWDYTVLDASFSWSAGDAVGMQLIGNTVQGWYKPSGGSWGSKGFASNVSINHVGRIGAWATYPSAGSPITIDDFGGGNYVLPTVKKDGGFFSKIG